MYVKQKSSYKIVRLPDDDFLTLINVDGEKLTFELKYLFDQEVGIKKNITNIVVEVAKDPPPSFSMVPTSKVINAKSILQFKNAHTALIKQYIENSVLLSITSDPTKNISNEVVPYYNRGYTTEQIPQLKKTEIVSVRTSDAVNPLSPVNAQHDLAVYNETQQQIAEQLLLNGYDPSSAYTMNELGLTLTEAYRGVHHQSPTEFKSLVEKALYKYKKLPHLKPIIQKFYGESGVVVDDDVSPDTYTIHRALVDARHVSVQDTLRLVLDSKTPDSLILTLRVRDSAGVTIQQLSRVFYPREYVKYYSIPVKPPIVKLSAHSNKAYATLAVKQVDPSAARIRLYKRVYDHHELSDEPFVLISEFDLNRAKGWMQVPVETSLGNTTIYRLVPTNEHGAIGTDFASIVVKPKMTNSSIRRVVMTAKAQSKSVLLEISKLPSDVVSFQIMREDITVDKGTLEFVEKPILVETPDPNRVYTQEDTSVKNNHVYAYYVRLYRRNGSHERRLVMHYEHVPLVENIVETNLVDATTTFTSNGYDVKFMIKTSVIKTKIDQIKLLLEKQGLYNIFSSDVADVREQLGKLISHNVKRVDLTSGHVENFGTVDGDSFSDLALRKITGVSDLRVGRKYRYIVTPLLRAPETLLESYVKSSTDSYTNRLYSYKPFKFLHPVVAQRGNIVTPSSIQRNYSKDPMTFGEIGAYTIIEIALDKEKSNVTNAIRQKRGSDVDVLTWSIQGLSKDVDHFQIITEHGGRKSIIGKSTCVPETENFVYVRRLNQMEIGLDIRYYICPVYLDFSRGNEILVSNTGDNT